MSGRLFTPTRGSRASVLAGCFSLAVLAAGGGSSATAAPTADPVRVEISVPRAGLSIGDSVTIGCTVILPRGARAGEPRPPEPDPLLDIGKYTVREEAAASGVIRRYGFLAYIVSADTVKIGPFAVRYVTAAGDSGEALSNVLVLPVAGFVENPDAPPKPSRDPLVIQSKGMPWWLIPLAAAILAALAGWLILKRPRKKPSPSAAPPRPVDELGEFERIRALRLGEAGQIKELYARVSGAMRAFMHRNMGFEALYSTTEEIKHSLARSPRDRAVKDSIREVLDESDMVKFAKYIPPDGLSSTIIDRAVVPVRKVLDDIARERGRLAGEEPGNASTAGGPEEGIGNPSVPVFPAGTRTRGTHAGGER